MIERIPKKEQAVLVGICHKEQSKEQMLEYLEELKLLTYSSGATPVKVFTQNIHSFDPATLIGKGNQAQNNGPYRPDT